MIRARRLSAGVMTVWSRSTSPSTFDEMQGRHPSRRRQPDGTYGSKIHLDGP